MAATAEMTGRGEETAKTGRKRLRPVRPKLDWMLLPNTLAYLTAWYGLFIGKFPVQVLSVALGIGLVFSAGFYRIKVEEVKSEDYLPTDSPSIHERTVTLLFDINEPDRPSKFPTIDYNSAPIATNNNRTVRENRTFTKKLNVNFDYLSSRQKRADRFTSAGSYAESCRQNSLILVAKPNLSSEDGSSYNMFTKAIFEEIDRLEQMILNITIPVKTADGKMHYYRYEPSNREDYDDGVCMKQPSGECAGFSLHILRHFFQADYDVGDDPFDMIFSGLPGIGLTYPKFFFNDFTKYIARVETDEEGFVKSIGAVREVFCVNEFFFDSVKSANEVWRLWEDAFDRFLRSGEFRSPYFDVEWMAEFQRGGEQIALITNMVPKVAITFAALMLWCCVGALATDAVRSKPWAGVLGVFATFFACSSGFGICLWNEPRFNPILMAVPLLVLAIGLDDMFIALEAWSRTDTTLSVEERMMTAMHISGTTIFITFFVNLIDFVVGNYTPFPLINKLSVYAIAAMVFDFVFQLTIFAPCLVIFGYLEKGQRHSCCCCLKAKPRSDALLDETPLHLICCTGGDKRKVRTSSVAVNWLCNFLTRMPVRLVSMSMFFAYIAVCGWSVSQLEVGLKPERVYRQSSNMYTFWQKSRMLFSEYADEVKLVINNELNYTQEKTRKRVTDLIDKAHSTGYFWPKETYCWLADFEKWRRRGNFSIKTNSQLLWQLQRYPGGFFDSNDPETLNSYRPHLVDVRLDENGTKIVKSRFLLRAKDMSSPARQIGMIKALRSITESVRPEIEMYAFGENFLLYDNYLTAVPTTLYYCGMTLGTTVGVAIFLIPHPACLFWVAIFVTSVLAGIVGMMRFWDMDLDSITLINLLIAISFCSDLIAHPIHVFLVSRVPNAATLPPQQVRLVKTRALIEEVTLAALPACVGTTLSVIAMSTSDAYIFATFFRVMFLSVILSIVHALIFVPAFMSFFGPSNPGITRPGEQEKSSDNGKGEAEIETPLKEQILTAGNVTNNSNINQQRLSSEEYAPEEDVQSFTAFIPAEAIRRRIGNNAQQQVVQSTTNQRAVNCSAIKLTIHHDLTCKGCDMCAHF